MSLDGARERILVATLGHIAFDGCSERALRAGIEESGVGRDVALCAFPAGMAEVVAFWSTWSDQRMLEAFAALDPAPAGVRLRVAAAVRLRLEVNDEHREAVRRVLAFLALPQNTMLGLRGLYDTVNAMWYAAGDTATDIRWYTKRALLATVYAATTAYWLDDESEGSAETWAFLDRRLDDVVSLGRFGARLGRLASPPPLRPS
jgi:ubiquinone biosynthesis protein COQ9